MSLTKKTNYLIIAGVHKAATTSLYTYLSWHPEICPSSIKETHFFSNESFVKRYNSYDAYFKTKSKSHKYFLEASPEYLFGITDTINQIKKVTIKPKIVFIFRNPSDKILSSFNHQKKRVLFSSDYTFENFVSDHLNVNSLDEINKEDLYSKEFFESSYIDFLPIWYDNFEDENIMVLFFDDLINDPKKTVKKVLNWINLDDKGYKDRIFNVENKSVEFKNRLLQKIIVKVLQVGEPFFRNNYKIKNALRNLYYFINVKKSNTTIKSSTLKYIDDLYKYKNDRLKQYLKLKGYTNFPQWLQ